MYFIASGDCARCINGLADVIEEAKKEDYNVEKRRLCEGDKAGCPEKPDI
jgi:hypothetical protein